MPDIFAPAYDVDLPRHGRKTIQSATALFKNLEDRFSATGPIPWPGILEFRE